MKYTREERLDIGRQIYDGELSRYQAADRYGISDQTARDYMRLYRDANQLPAKRASHHDIPAPSFKTESSEMKDLEYMTKKHSDQGSVYSSKSFNELLPMYGITRSMSRAGTPTDNAAMEAINGWIKAELFMDLHVTGDRPIKEEIDDYIVFFNELRPAYSLNYLTPKQYRESYSSLLAV